MHDLKKPKTLLGILTGRAFIVTITLVLTVGLAAALWNMNFWPSDEKDYYVDAARMVPSLKHLSDMHQQFQDGKFLLLHGKEFFFVAISYAQRLMNDYESIRPLMLVSLLAIMFSALLLYELGRLLWGKLCGGVIYFFFITSFWPLLYVLFTKHQTLGLFFFSLSAWALGLSTKAKWKVGLYVLSGCFFGMAFHSSTVSFLYAPYLLGLAAWVVVREKADSPGKRVALAFRLLAGLLAGTVVILIVVNYPSLQNFQGFLDYVRMSKDNNHFYYHQPVLQQWLPGIDVGKVRGGLGWVIKYFFLVMPVLFPAFLAAAAFLIRTAVAFPGKRRAVATILILSLSTAILAETRGVAQYGANYFTAFIGILLAVGYAFHLWWTSFWPSLTAERKRLLARLLATVLVVQVLWNGWVFCSDIYPSRMATTFISDYIRKQGFSRIYTYRLHPLRYHILEQLDPEILKTVSWIPVQTVFQVRDGVMLLPPVSKDNIFLAMTSDYHDYDPDLVLNELFRRGKIRDVAKASFKTIGSSLIWQQEEEILAYRYLDRGQFRGDIDKNRVWIIDGQKLAGLGIGPDPEGIECLDKGIRQIGTKDRLVYMFNGFRGFVPKKTMFKGVMARIYKVGEPTDGLVAHLYRPVLQDGVAVWVPSAPQFMSLPTAASTISSSTEGGRVDFTFEEPIAVEPGLYFIAIHRTGAPDDNNYYRIYEANVRHIEAGL